MGLNDATGNPFLGGVWQFSVARVWGGLGRWTLIHLVPEWAQGQGCNS